MQNRKVMTCSGIARPHNLPHATMPPFKNGYKREYKYNI